MRTDAHAPSSLQVSSRLSGVRRLTLSCPGVILSTGPRQLSETAALWPGAAEIVQEMCHMGIEVFLISQVGDRWGMYNGWGYDGAIRATRSSSPSR